MDEERRRVGFEIMGITLEDLREELLGLFKKSTMVPVHGHGYNHGTNAGQGETSLYPFIILVLHIRDY